MRVVNPWTCIFASALVPLAIFASPVQSVPSHLLPLDQRSRAEAPATSTRSAPARAMRRSALEAASLLVLRGKEQIPTKVVRASSTPRRTIKTPLHRRAAACSPTALISQRNSLAGKTALLRRCFGDSGTTDGDGEWEAKKRAKQVAKALKNLDKGPQLDVWPRRDRRLASGGILRKLARYVKFWRRDLGGGAEGTAELS